MDYTRFFNRSALQMYGNPLRLLGEKAIENPDLISMDSGIPNPDTFPFLEATVALRDGSELHIGTEELHEAMQYSKTNGLPKLVEWLKQWQKSIHSPPTYNSDDPLRRMDCIIVNGSMDGIAKTLQIVVEEGDNVLVEQPSFPGPSVVLQNRFANMLSVESDEDGLNPKHLLKVISRWKPSDSKNRESGIPKVLYCSPSAGNPNGTRLTMERKREIYKIAQDYDLLILEDDPYFFLQFGEPKVPSFLSIDVDGRVVRFDSFSKLVSAGMRVGFVSGPSQIIEKIRCIQQVSTYHASGLSQIFLYKFLEKLGPDGFIKFMDGNRKFYQEKRDQCVKAAEKHLTGLAEWTIPSGGLFMWLKLLNLADSNSIAVKAVEHGVLFVPGYCMLLADPETQTPYIRLAYSIPNEEQINTALSRIADVLRESTAKDKTG